MHSGSLKGDCCEEKCNGYGDQCWCRKWKEIAMQCVPDPEYVQNFYISCGYPYVSTPTPTPIPVTVRARAVTMAALPLTCSQITDETNYRDGTSFDLKQGATSQGVKAQSGSTYVSWSVPANIYTLVPGAATGASIRAYLTDAGGAHFGSYATTLAAGETSTFDVAYGPFPAWFQAQGGDVYGAQATLQSYVPSALTFNLDGAGGTPGIVTYGGSYDFAEDALDNGANRISSTHWLAKEGYDTTDYYDGYIRMLFIS